MGLQGEGQLAPSLAVDLPVLAPDRHDGMVEARVQLFELNVQKVALIFREMSSIASDDDTSDRGGKVHI